jgi:large subunit ribosomal protein L2
MAVVKTKPTSAGRRFVIKVVNPELHKGAPYKPAAGAADPYGWAQQLRPDHDPAQGGGHKQHYRI